MSTPREADLYARTMINHYYDTLVWCEGGNENGYVEPTEWEQEIYDFYLTHRETLTTVEPWASDASQAGHDLALTRNGHGTGFWDHDAGKPGDVLTEGAVALGEYYLELIPEYIPGTTTLEGTRYPQVLDHVLMDMREDAHRIAGTWEPEDEYFGGAIVSAYELTYDLPDGHYTAYEMATTEDDAKGQARNRNDVPTNVEIRAYLLENLYATHELPD
jgi:hypothetical protein